MNILFVYSYNIPVSQQKPLKTVGEMHFGISYLSSYIKDKGHNTKLLVLSDFFGKKNFKLIDKTIQEFKPELVCFTSVTTEYPFILKIARHIKQNQSHIYLLIGGSHASLCPDKVIKDDFDAVCIGEGEQPLLELISQLEKEQTPSNILNLWIKNNSNIEVNTTRPYIHNLDNLPFPDREMWFKWVNESFEKNNFINVLLGRGCPFSCTYCSNHALKKLASGTYVRFRSPENIIQELNEINKQFPVINILYLEVETITANIKWFNDFCSKLKEFNKSIDNKISYRANLRIIPNTDYDQIFKIMKEANFNHINIGLESGSERVRKDILNRNYSNKDVINAVKIAKKYDIKVTFYNLIGLPGETEEDFKQTIEINRICQPDNHFTSIFYPYPGTVLYEKCINENLINHLDSNMERLTPAINQPEFNKKLIQKHFIWFDYYVYKGFKPMHKILFSVFKNKIKTNPVTYNWGRKLSLFFSINS
ncbi:MAG: radical SAM protein [Cyanobacteriota bacterium]